LIEAAREAAAARGAQALLAMAMAQRASTSVLTAAAAVRVPTAVLARMATAPVSAAAGDHPPPERLATCYAAPGSGARFGYPGAVTFAEQARLGGSETGVVPAGDRLWAIIARSGDDVLVRAVLAEDGAPEPARLASALDAIPVARGGTVRAFTSDAEVLAAAAGRGFSQTAGALHLIALSAGMAPERLPRKWQLQAIDRA
jgi:hypothetical protein